MGSRKKSIQMTLIAFARNANDAELDAAIDILKSFKDKPVRKTAKKKAEKEPEKQAEKAKAASGVTDGQST